MKCVDNTNLLEVEIINVFALMFETHVVVRTVQSC